MKDKVAVVTGGSSGIGAAASRMLAEAGAKVVVCYNKGEARAKEVIASLAGSGHRTQHLVLEDSATMRQAADDVRKAFGRCDILVNSAGFTKPVPHANLEALDDALFDSVFVANVRGPFAVIRAFSPLLKESKDGVIINVSSVAGVTGSGSSIAYAASKAALDNMSMALARVMGPEVRVICVSPGAVNTDFVAGRSLDNLKKHASESPLKRVVQPEDVARTIMGCVLHMPTATGIKIVCDGGRFLG
ncbi:MAG TPA: SDR family oxidoreductase [Xanthobacteraceae bacterium]|nr:SDR family oxidoreductase [Xanthobacteraceae bacterium]